MELSKNIKIIIVDDNVPFRKAFKRLLEDEYSCSVVAEADTGEDFLRLNELSDASLVFLDLFMPGRNGIEIAAEALTNYPAMQIIAVTMHSEKAYIEELIETGFRGVIAKPRLFDELYAAMQTVLTNSKYFPKTVYTKKILTL